MKTKPAKSVNAFANLERRAQLAIKKTPAGRKLDRQAAQIERDLAARKMSKQKSHVLKLSLRCFRDILVVKWIAAEITTRNLGKAKK